MNFLLAVILAAVCVNAQMAPHTFLDGHIEEFYNVLEGFGPNAFSSSSDDAGVTAFWKERFPMTDEYFDQYEIDARALIKSEVGLEFSPMSNGIAFAFIPGVQQPIASLTRFYLNPELNYQNHFSKRVSQSNQQQPWDKEYEDNEIIEIGYVCTLFINWQGRNGFQFPPFHSYVVGRYSIHDLYPDSLCNNGNAKRGNGNGNNGNGNGNGGGNGNGNAGGNGNGNAGGNGNGNAGGNGNGNAGGNGNGNAGGNRNDVILQYTPAGAIPPAANLGAIFTVCQFRSLSNPELGPGLLFGNSPVQTPRPDGSVHYQARTHIVFPPNLL